MVSEEKLIKQGIKYNEALFKELERRLAQGILTTDTLEDFLARTEEYTTANPLVTTGYKDTMIRLILQETNNHKFSRPAQKELARVTIEQYIGDLITNVGEDIKNDVRDIVKQGYNEGLSQKEIAENISNKIESIGKTRANVIARTEIARTASVSDYIINKERGATYFTVGCRNTCCEKCALEYHGVDNPTVDNSSREFTQGTPVKFNMDQTDKLPPLHPNCRCYPIFYK